MRISLLILSFLMVLAGCGSKKVSTSKKELTQTKTVSKDSLVKIDEASSAKSVTVIDFQKKTETSIVEFDGKPGDTLTVKEFGPGGNLISHKQIFGSGKAKLETVTSTGHEVQEKSEQHQSRKTVEASKTEQSDSVNIEETFEKELLRKASGYLWKVILSGIVLVLILYFMGRIGLLGWLKKHVTRNPDA